MNKKQQSGATVSNILCKVSTDGLQAATGVALLSKTELHKQWVGCCWAIIHMNMYRLGLGPWLSHTVNSVTLHTYCIMRIFCACVCMCFFNKYNVPYPLLIFDQSIEDTCTPLTWLISLVIHRSVNYEKKTVGKYLVQQFSDIFSILSLWFWLL